jgi:hypothetical protein
MYKVKYITLQADLELSHEISTKNVDDENEVEITFSMENRGEVVATDTYVLLQFRNVKKIVRCAGKWQNISNRNDNIPTVQLIYTWPIVRPVRMPCDSVVVKVDSDVEQIEARVIIGAANMRTREATYVIHLKEKAKNV